MERQEQSERRPKTTRRGAVRLRLRSTLPEHIAARRPTPTKASRWRECQAFRSMKIGMRIADRPNGSSRSRSGIGGTTYQIAERSSSPTAAGNGRWHRIQPPMAPRHTEARRVAAVRVELMGPASPRHQGFKSLSQEPGSAGSFTNTSAVGNPRLTFVGLAQPGEQLLTAPAPRAPQHYSLSS